MIRYGDINELAELLDTLVCDEEININIIAKHEIIKELFNHLIVFNEYTADSIVMPSPYDTNYNKELMLTVYSDGITLDVRTVYNEDDGYFKTCDEDCCMTYIHEDCDLDCIELNSHGIIFGFTKENELEKCCIDTSDDGHTISQTYVSEDGKSRYFKSFYSDDLSLVKNMMDTWK